MTKKNRYIIDTESNGFLREATRIWWIVLRDIDTDEVFKFEEGDLRYQQQIGDAARIVVAHNGVAHDYPLLRKIHKYEIPSHILKRDSMLMSEAQDYYRFPSGSHSLEAWGEFLKEPKIEFDPAKFLNPTPEDLEEMGIYCVGDTKTNRLAYLYLVEELKNILKRKPLFEKSLEIEHDVAEFCIEAEIRGWRIDVPEAKRVFQELEEKISQAENEIRPLLPPKVKAIDKEPKEPKWIKNGNYAQHTVNWFNINPEEGKSDSPPILGPYTRIEIQIQEPTNDAIKDYLYTIGWKPDDWNYKKVDGEFVKVSPKLSESSLLVLGEKGALINNLTTHRSRRDILRGWIESLDSEGRLHGSCFTIATPTGRARHAGIVNVPSADAPYGPEIRKLFIASEGYKVVGADSSGNQFRALCHYLKDESFTTLVLTGDVHKRNAEILSDIIGSTVPRGTAKPFIYAFLFGAGGEKLALILTGKRNGKLGKKAKDEFIKRVPGLEALVKKINKLYDQTSELGKAYIFAADGRKIYCDSRHKSLNYLLQSFEAISCKAAVSYQLREFKKRGWWLNKVFPLIWYHDENEVEAEESIAEEVKEIMIESYREAGKVFNMMILDGAGKVGDNWYDVH